MHCSRERRYIYNVRSLRCNIHIHLLKSKFFGIWTHFRQTQNVCMHVYYVCISMCVYSEYQNTMFLKKKNARKETNKKETAK